MKKCSRLQKPYVTGDSGSLLVWFCCSPKKEYLWECNWTLVGRNFTTENCYDILDLPCTYYTSKI